MSMNGQVDLLEGETVLDCERRLRDQVGGPWADDVRPQQLARARLRDDLHETLRLSQRERAPRSRERELADLDVEPLVLRLFLT